MQKENIIYYGDNADAMKNMKAESVDLIYLDPPFNSKRNYNYSHGAFSKENKINKALAFTDTWNIDIETEKDIKNYIENAFEAKNVFSNFLTAFFSSVFHSNKDIISYLLFLSVRLYEMKRILKQSGSIFLHCDGNASHYIKIIMDALFTAENFRSEIVWQYDGPQGPSKTKLAAKHDIIFWYVKDKSKVKTIEEYMYSYEEMSFEEAKKKGYKKDEKGMWYYDLPKGNYTDETIVELRKANRVKETKNGKTRIKYFIKEKDGKLLRKKKMQDIWSDIPSLGLVNSFEKEGYPTQKPIALILRIIQITTDEGDTVFDPFLGSGTTSVAGRSVLRKCIGIDSCLLSIYSSQKRMEKLGIEYETIGLPKTKEDIYKLIHKKDNSEVGKKQFAYWSIEKVGGIALNNKYADGFIYFQKNEKDLGKASIIVISSDTAEKDIIEKLIYSMGKTQSDMSFAITFADIDKSSYNLAKKQGKYRKADKIQMLSSCDILGGKKFDLP